MKKTGLIVLFIFVSFNYASAELKTGDLISLSSATATYGSFETIKSTYVRLGDFSVITSTTQFLGKAEKAEDSEKLDGKDSSDFLEKGRAARTFSVEGLTVNKERRVWQLEILE